MELSDVVKVQFLLAGNGISIEESNRLAFFELEGHAELAIAKEKAKKSELELLT